MIQLMIHIYLYETDSLFEHFFFVMDLFTMLISCDFYNVVPATLGFAVLYYCACFEFVFAWYEINCFEIVQYILENTADLPSTLYGFRDLI